MKGKLTLQNLLKVLDSENVQQTDKKVKKFKHLGWKSSLSVIDKNDTITR